MKQATQIFGKENIKGVDENLQNEIIRRFNDFETLQRVMHSVGNNLKHLVQTANNMDHRDKVDIYKLANLLQDATTKDWLKENVLYY